MDDSKPEAHAQGRLLDLAHPRFHYVLNRVDLRKINLKVLAACLNEPVGLGKPGQDGSNTVLYAQSRRKS